MPKKTKAPTFEHKIVKVEDLIPYARNSRTHSDDQVAQIAGSIKEFGFTNPVLCDSDNGIIAGHGRVMAAQKCGIKEVPCITVDGWTDAQRRAYVIADNQLPLNAGWDMDMLKVEMQELSELGFDVDLIGFEEDMLSGLLDDLTNDGNTDPDDVPDVPKETVVKTGDIWRLGNHRLMCGDSTSIDSVQALMGEELADQLITDPPYNVAYEGKNRRRPHYSK